MELCKLLSGIDYTILQGDLNISVNKIEYDSRKVEIGDVFVCIKGYSTDGHKYINSALQNGAKVIICEMDIDMPKDAVVIKVSDSRKALAATAANYYDNPAEKLKVIGVTGTNGKTTSTYMIKAILEEAGFKTGLIGTICNYIGDEKLHADRTTPESLELQALFARMVKEKIDYCIMEVSSHSLYLDRVYGVNFKYGIFTNLTRDHLDFHKTFENYFEAKLKLFSSSQMSIVNIDDPYGEKVLDRVENSKYTYGISSQCNLKADNIAMNSRGVEYRLVSDKGSIDIDISIPGRYNVYNSLCAAGIAINENISLDVIQKALNKVQVPGRCELVTKGMNLGYDVIVDYAHSPDGLENILKTAREFTTNKLITVFGCGGNRDKTKRPIMGKIGTELSDIAIITSDNPRDEEPSDIIKDILEGVKTDNYIVIENRKEAIKKSLEIASEGDVVVIAGKGHEDYQILKNNEVIAFDEKIIIKEILGHLKD